MTKFYVTVIRDRRVGYLAGPYDLPPTPEMVDRYRRIACDIDPWCDFDAFGITAVTANNFPAGVLTSDLKRSI